MCDGVSSKTHGERMFAREAPRGPETMNETRSGRCVMGHYIIACDIPGFRGERKRTSVQQHNQPRSPRKYQGEGVENMQQHHRGVNGRCVTSSNLYTGSSRGVSGCTSNLFSQRAADDRDGSKPAGSDSDPPVERGCQ